MSNDWIKIKEACEILSRGRIEYGVSIGEIRKKGKGREAVLSKSDIIKFKNRPRKRRALTVEEKRIRKTDLECLKNCIQKILYIKSHSANDDPFKFAPGTQLQQIYDSIDIFQKRKHNNAMAKA